MPETALQRAIITLKFARKMTNDLARTIPPDKAAYQPSPKDNHLLWTLGHLAISYQWLANLIDGKPNTLPANYDELFGGKSAPHADAKRYPSVEELWKHHDSMFDRMIAAAESMSETDCTKSCNAETGGFARDRLDVIEKAAWHEGWHAGQLSSIRRALGLKPLMG